MLLLNKLTFKINDLQMNSGERWEPYSTLKPPWIKDFVFLKIIYAPKSAPKKLPLREGEQSKSTTSISFSRI